MTAKYCNSEKSREVAENLKRVGDNIAEAALSSGRRPEDISLMAVTKTVPPELVNLAIAGGVRLLGENRAQELLDKFDAYDKNGVSIHFIGGLQTNKVRKIADKVDLIQSLNSERLAREVERCCAAIGKVMDVLIEVNIGGEASKSGVPPDGLSDFAAGLAAYPHIRLRGLMAIPPICDSPVENERYFCQMEQFFIDIKHQNRDNRNIDILSMGMSGDYMAAIRRGATLVRLGTAIFGGRM